MLIVPNDLILLNANYSILVVDQAIKNNMVQSFNAHRPHPINLVAIEDSVSREVTEKQTRFIRVRYFCTGRKEHQTTILKNLS